MKKEKIMAITGIVFLIFAAMTAVGCVTEQKTASTPEPPGEVPVEKKEVTLESHEEKFVGNVWTNGISVDPMFTKLWNQVTPENGGKWGSVEASRDKMNWSDLDNAYKIAKENNFPIRLHVLIWGNQQPEWLNDLSPDEQREEIEEWMSLLSERYPEFNFIDVVNEPLHAPPPYKEALGGDGATGWDWVITSFKLARKYFPNSELHLNDFSITSDNAATYNYLQIIKLLQERALIDGVGVQGHFLEAFPRVTISGNLDKLAATGLPIYITELDIEFNDDSIQANRLKDLFTLYWEHESVKGITFWGYKQGMVWRQAAYLVRENGQPRIALEWLAAYLRGEDFIIPPPESGIRLGSPDKITIEAESFDTAEGIKISENFISYLDGGDWMGYEKVVLRPEYSGLRIVYAKGQEPSAKIHIKLGKLNSEIVTTVELKYSGEDWHTFKEIDIPWNPREGLFNLFIECEGGVGIGNIDYIEFHIPGA